MKGLNEAFLSLHVLCRSHVENHYSICCLDLSYYHETVTTFAN